MSESKLSNDVLLRLVGEGLVLFYCCSERLVGRQGPGAAMTLSGEPVADLNYLLLSSADPSAVSLFESYVDEADKLGLPFAAMIAPGADEIARPACEARGLIHATQWPLMVCPGEKVREYPVDGITISRVSREDQHTAMCEILASAFIMPADSVARAMPMPVLDGPSFDVFVAERDGEVLSTVTVTRHGSVIGIWAMGTRADAQGQGAGKALLSNVMSREHANGADAFFLGATPSGFPLYQKLGYETFMEAAVWVRGETHQA